MDAAAQVAAQCIVYFRTLGYFEALVRGEPAAVEGGGVGRKQLIRMLAYLITRRDERISRHDLAIIAGGRQRKRFRYVVTGELDMLDAWGLSAALTVSRDGIMLRTHPSWCTDTDHLVALYEAAEERIQQDAPSAAILFLEQARRLCQGRYFGDYEIVADDTLRDADEYWLSYQRQTIHRLIALYRAQGLASHRAQLLNSLKQLLHLPGTGNPEYAVAAEVYELNGQHRLAEYYRRKLRRN